VIHPDPDQLAAIALGDTPGPATASHLAHCAQCAQSLTELRDILDRTSRVLPLEQPPPHVWEGIAHHTRTSHTAGPLPVAYPALAPRRRPGLRGTGWLLAAVIAAVSALGGWWIGSRPTPTATRDISTTALTALGTNHQLGTAVLEQTGSSLDIRVTAPALHASNGYLEVWLLNTDSTRMLSLGVLPTGTSRAFPVTREVLERGYLIVDISQEPFDTQPAHSGDTLARGSLPKL